MMAWPLLTAALVFAQAGALPPVEADRLRLCLDQARSDPATAIATASQWANESLGGTGSAAPLARQCLGFAYMSLLRWEAAEEAFLAARDATPAADRQARARLGAMAGSAALAAGSFASAEQALAVAQADAEAAGLGEEAGAIAADRARALVGEGREAEAGVVLTGAQIIAPQAPEVWLLSAALARREGDLRRAQGHIQTAAALVPPSGALAADVGLEAGLIAALAGENEAARRAWQSVRAVAPGSPQSATADTYLAQLDWAEPEMP